MKKKKQIQNQKYAFFRDAFLFSLPNGLCFFVLFFLAIYVSSVPFGIELRLRLCDNVEFLDSGTNYELPLPVLKLIERMHRCV